MKKILILVGAIAGAWCAVVFGPRVNVVHVPGVGQVVWQQGSAKRWVLFPEEKCR